MPSWHQDSSICAQVGPKMDEVGPKTVQSRTKMAPGKPKLAASWPQDCTKAGFSQTCIKPIKSNGKTMILCAPKMAQVRTKSAPYQCRSASGGTWSEQGRVHIAPDRLLVAFGWPKLAPIWLHESPKRRHDGPTCAQVAVRWSNLGPKTAKIGSMWRLVRPSWPQDGRSWAQDGPK